MPVEIPHATEGLMKKVKEIVVKFYETLGARVGASGAKTVEIPFMQQGQIMDEPTDLFTGDKSLAFPAGYSRDADIYIEQPYPLPMTVLGIIPKIEITEGV